MLEENFLMPELLFFFICLFRSTKEFVKFSKLFISKSLFFCYLRGQLIEKFIVRVLLLLLLFDLFLSFWLLKFMIFFLLFLIKCYSFELNLWKIFDFGDDLYLCFLINFADHIEFFRKTFHRFLVLWLSILI